MKPIKQRLGPKVGVAGRLAARGLFAARLCMWIATWACTFGLFDGSSNKELLLCMEQPGETFGMPLPVQDGKRG